MSIEGDKARNIWAQLRPVAELTPAFFAACDAWFSLLDKKESELVERDRQTSVALAEAEQTRAQVKTQAARLSAAIGKLE